jgi:hypothetical protein
MAQLWPWLAIAGAGALHGLSPANGWMLAAACGVHARDEAQARRALGPIAFGQVASMSALAWAVSRGLAIDRALMRDLAVVLLVAAVSWFAVRGTSAAIRVGTRARSAGLALWSFLMASAQGAGLMLVPALVPLCAGGALAGALKTPGSSPLTLAVAAVAVHTAAMLFVTGVLATGVCRGVRAHRCARPSAIERWVWTVALAVAGAGFMTLPS